jgi:aminoglycoside 3-N-acetyltransferase
MVAIKELRSAFETLRLTREPVIAHASLKSFGYVDGGVYALLDAMLTSFGSLIMPTHTYKTMITPPNGPEHNGITYGSQQVLNRMAEHWSPDMPADKMMGIVPETLRRNAKAKRSSHPILSFAGVNADDILATQTIEDPLAPIGELAKRGGYALLLGVDHTVNTSIHYAEKLAGRRQFVRWALTQEGIVACPGFPGDSSGFGVIAQDIAPFIYKIKVGEAIVQAVPLDRLFKVVAYLIKQEPSALLCTDLTCERCNEIRRM